jgi:hypothetical protein
MPMRKTKHRKKKNLPREDFKPSKRGLEISLGRFEKTFRCFEKDF